MWAFHRALTVNGALVPAVRRTASLVDPYSLSGSIAGMDMSVDLEVDVVDFSSYACHSWLVGPHGVINAPPAVLCNIPLLQEMIKNGQPSSALAANDIESFVFVKIRGKILLVANTSLRVSLALAGHSGVEPGSFEDEIGILGWFLTELDNDIKKLKENHKIRCDALNFSNPNDTEPLNDEATLAIKKGLVSLMASDNVFFAEWLPDMKSLQVTMTSGDILYFQVEVDITNKTMQAIHRVFANAWDYAKSRF